MDAYVSTTGTNGVNERHGPKHSSALVVSHTGPLAAAFRSLRGARRPLDTNLVEQTLIIPVRYLAASFNHRLGPSTAQ